MKTIKALFLLGSLFLVACYGDRQDNPAANNMLAELLENKNLFKLQAELNNNKNNLSDSRFLYYEMYCGQAFNNLEKSSYCADILLDKYKKQLNDTVIAEILQVKADNYVRNYHYKEAADAYSLLLEQYKTVLNDEEIANYENIKSLFGTLSAVKPQQIHKRTDAEIKAYRNLFNHLMTPVKCGIADEFIFDSGANISTITDSCAKKMGLTIYESDISVGTTTDAKLKSRLAAADSFYVGDILFENVVFLVVPAEQMSFPQVNYEIHGVIGFPVLYQMEEIRIRKDGRVVVPKTSENRNLNNMFLSGLKPAVQLTSHNDTLIFLFDTGANTSELSKKYYENHRTEVEQNGALQTRSRGGGGGIVEAEEYELKDFPYTIGAKSSVLPKISVVVQDYDFVKHFDGNLGQDVITQFNEMILNFKHMYIDFE
jgi:hypothetical protein